jgi:hypothetical protein
VTTCNCDQQFRPALVGLAESKPWTIFVPYQLNNGPPPGRNPVNIGPPTFANSRNANDLPK